MLTVYEEAPAAALLLAATSMAAAAFRAGPAGALLAAAAAASREDAANERGSMARALEKARVRSHEEVKSSAIDVFFFFSLPDLDCRLVVVGQVGATTCIVGNGGCRGRQDRRDRLPL